MAFNPSTTIYLCNVSIDNTYKNQINFATTNEQFNYFSKRIRKTFANYLTIRKTLPDGSLQSSVKVNANIDDLQNCNYMFYQNANHGTKYFYAFITNLIYVNENTTEIVFETDAHQTWLFDVQIKQSYVVREHSATDEIGDNIVPEKFNFQDYIYSKIISDTTLSKWGYLVGASELNFETTSTSAGHLMSGIYQGLYFYYYENENELSDFLASLDVDCIEFIALIPKFCVSANTIGANDSDRAKGQGFMYSSDDYPSAVVNIDFGAHSFTFDGYTPKNNKLYTSPFFSLVVTNHNGGEVEYAIEDFSDRRNVTFTMHGDVSANPSITLIPNNYKGLSNNYDSGISISGFPQCSYVNDTFKLWLAKNQYGIGLDTLGNVAQIVTGVATGVATGGVGGVLGASQVVSGVQGVLGTINTVYQASKEPNRTQSGNAKNNLLTAIKMNKFDFYCRRIKKDYARTVDDFFTMFGYQTNRVKVPNVNSRPYYNYVQTVDVNVVGAIPNDDMLKLKQMYNNGVTFWKPTATIGDYSVDNSPS